MANTKTRGTKKKKDQHCEKTEEEWRRYQNDKKIMRQIRMMLVV